MLSAFGASNKNHRRSQSRSELGFNLIELMIAICIIAILVAIVIVTLYGQDRKADHAVAIGNLMTGAKTVDSVWFSELANQSQDPIQGGAYRDYSPPEAMKSSAFFQANGWVPVDAHYMSIKEPMINWVDVTVGGTSGPVASADVGSYMLAEGYGFRINGVWKGGNQVAAAVANPADWSLLPRKIGIVTNMYYWDGAWQDNTNTQYLTLVTLEQISQLAHFYTLNVGVTIAGGTFDWKGGAGNPGESFGDELASEKPTGDSSATSPPPGTEPTTPPDTQPTTPPDTQPTTPPDTQPTTPPPPGPPAGINQAASIGITPQSLNLGSNGVLKARIDLISGYDAGNINIATVRAYSAAPTDAKTNGKGTLTLTFNREDLVGVPVGESVMFLVTGQYTDGSAFQGWDYIKVMAH